MPFKNEFLFQVTNEGPWHVPEIDVVVSWPYQLEGGQDGSPNGLLYLAEAPEITPAGAGQCFINSRRINSLGNFRLL